jgi:hypothetical protein
MPDIEMIAKVLFALFMVTVLTIYYWGPPLVSFINYKRKKRSR